MIAPSSQSMSTSRETKPAPKAKQHERQSLESTLFLRLPTGSTVQRHELETACSGWGPVKKTALVRPPKDQRDTKAPYAFVRFVNADDAVQAARELKTVTQAGGVQVPLRVELASSAENRRQQQRRGRPPKEVNEQQVEGAAVESPASESLETQKKTARVILRNLSFYATPNDIRQALAPLGGTIADIHIPVVSNKKQKRGFAFVTFSQRSTAAACVQRGTFEIRQRGGVQAAWSLPRNLYEARKNKPKSQQSSTTMTTKRPAESDRKDSDGKAKDDNEESISSSDTGPSSSSSIGDDSDSDSNIDSDSEEEEGTAVTRQKKVVDLRERKQDVGQKRSLFVRNLPFDAQRHDIFELFKTYGHIDGIFTVKDPATGLFKGSAFVSYRTQACVERALENMSSLVMKGRTLHVQMAVDRDTASTFNEKNKLPKDKRNLYLAEAGRVTGDEWTELPEVDRKKRQESQKDAQTALKSPLFSINPTRISIRNLAKHVDEKQLKALLVNATEEGMSLVAVEDQVAHWRATGDYTARELVEKASSQDAVIPEFDAKNVKKFIPSVFIVRDYSLKKGVQPASRGFAFCEFLHHTHALACLRQLNNNPRYSVEFCAGGRRKTSGNAVPRLIVEFAVENKIKAMQQAKNRAAHAANAEQQKERSASHPTGAEKKRRSRGAIQRDRKRQRALVENSGNERSIGDSDSGSNEQVSPRTMYPAEVPKPMPKEDLIRQRRGRRRRSDSSKVDNTPLSPPGQSRISIDRDMQNEPHRRRQRWFE